MSNPNTGPDATLANEQDPSDVVTPDSDSNAADDDTEPETYPAETVRKLRDENAKFRTRAREAETRVDELSRELFALKVASLDKLEDASDLEYNPELLADPDALAAKVDELITARPHYAKRPRPSGSVGQGNRGDSAAAPTFASLLQQR
jgi:polysaccharide pyruvyl transferase WcaK-like protein